MRPQFLSLGERLTIGFERVCARLDRLNELTDTEEFLELRRTTNLELTASAEVSLIESAVGEEWELELISVLGAMTITVNESGRFRYCKQFSTADCQPAIGLILRGGNQYTIVSTGNAAPTKVTVQLKQRTRPKPRKTQSSGNIEPAMDARDTSYPADDNLNRHGPVNVKV